MLLISCPWCGPRDEMEFHFGGPGALIRPEPYHSVSDATWADYLYFRDNRRGIQDERWQHVFGCRRWFVMTRDTVSHDVLKTRAMGLSAGVEP